MFYHRKSTTKILLKAASSLFKVLIRNIANIFSAPVVFKFTDKQLCISPGFTEGACVMHSLTGYGFEKRFMSFLLFVRVVHAKKI